MAENKHSVMEQIALASRLTGTSLVLPEELHTDLPIEVTLAGQPQQNLFGILNELFGGLDDLNRSFVRGFRCTVEYGEDDTFYYLSGGKRAECTAAELTGVLSKMDNTGETEACGVKLHAERLRNIRIHVVASNEDYKDVDWKELVMQSDYCLFVLNTTALLSMCDRKVLRSWLLPNMKEALGIILANDNLILEADREDINASLERFFHGEVPFFRFPEEDAEKISALLSELESKCGELRRNRQTRSETILLKDALEAVEMQLEVLSTDTQQLEAAIELMNKKAKELPERQKSACRRARMQYTAKMKVEAAAEISGFQQSMSEKLKSEIQAGESIEEMQRIIPDYISDQWKNESERILDDIRAQAKAMQDNLSLYIQKDIRDYIEDGSDAHTADYVFTLTEKYSDMTDMTFNAKDADLYLESKKDNSKLVKYGVIASGVALVLFSHPLIGAAVAIFGSKKATQAYGDNSRQSLMAAAEQMNMEVYNDMNVWLDGVIAEIEQNISASVEECYQRMMDVMIKALNNRREDHAGHEEQLKELSDLRDEIKSMGIKAEA